MPLAIVEVLAANAVVAAVALALGEEVLRRAEALVGAAPRPPSLQRLGTALLAGLGACALGGVVLAAVHLFRWQAFAVCGAAILVLGRRRLRAYAPAGVAFVRRGRRAGAGVLLPVGVALAALAVQWLAALAPPVEYDELAYHLPEARVLADGHSLQLMLSSHRVGSRIYGNLPTLLETLWGEALTIRGTALVHALHLSLAVGLVLLAAGVARALWGARAAALAAAGIALYPELTGNAVTAYVDAGATAFEAGAVLLAARWLVERDDGDAAAAALLAGFAAAVKYTALPTAAALAAVVAVVARRRRSWRLPLALAAIALVACGYWYGKNLRFGNPVFPFAFGHPGVSDGLYRGWLESIHQFGHRSLGSFLETPARFATLGSLAPFLGFALAPVALAARGPTRVTALLLAYVAAYTTYWYWLASSQTRFLMTAIVVAIVLAAAALGAARGARGLLAAAAVALLVGVAAQAIRHSFDGNLRAALSATLDTSKARVALGLESEHAFLHRAFGCQVDAADVLARRGLAGGVALWYLAPTADYPRHNRLAPIHVEDATQAGVRAQLRAQGVAFALAQGLPLAALSPYRSVQQVLARAARPIWRGGGCTLYRLDLGPGS